MHHMSCVAPSLYKPGAIEFRHQCPTVLTDLSVHYRLVATGV